MGPPQKTSSQFRQVGEKVHPDTFGKVKVGERGDPKSPSVKKRTWNSQWPPLVLTPFVPFRSRRLFFLVSGFQISTKQKQVEICSDPISADTICPFPNWSREHLGVITQGVIRRADWVLLDFYLFPVYLYLFVFVFLLMLFLCLKKHSFSSAPFLPLRLPRSRCRRVPRRDPPGASPGPRRTSFLARKQLYYYCHYYYYYCMCF